MRTAQLSITRDPEFQEPMRGAIHAFIASLAETGRPNAADFASARESFERLEAHGEAAVRLARGLGIVEKLLINIAFTVAVMAHQPGGVTLWGMHFQAEEKVVS